MTKRTITPERLASLVGVEYELCALDGDLRSACSAVKLAGLDGCAEASSMLIRARRLVKRALRKLDGPLTEAARLREQEGPAPF